MRIGLRLGLMLFTGYLIACNAALAQSRTVFVHLFEWSWNDIANECEQHLGPKGFAAVQVSPPQKSIIQSEWWSRYQPVSYEVEGRGGTRAEFSSMINRCAAVGVDIYADAVINHMAAHDRNFPGVPFGPNDFHNCTSDIDYGDRWQVQNCDLVSLNDLKTESDYVRGKIADYMNDLIGLGVKGFRIDAAKHIPVQDIAAIKARLNSNVYIFQEVIGAPGEPIQPSEYTGVGDVTEFNFERTLGHYFKGRAPLKDLRNIVDFQGWLPSNKAVVFVSNHDDQRQNTNNTLTYKDPGDLYYIGEIFALAYPYGYPKVMSSYFFEGHDQGPPTNGPHSGDACGVNWVCEHRWRGVANMVGFRNTTAGEFRISDWWDNGNNQIAFGRGGLGFVAINREDNQAMNQSLQTGMSQGVYCDIVNGEFDAVNKSCDGPTITINANGTANFNVASIAASAIHVGAMLEGDPDPDGPVWQNAYFRGTPNSWGTTAMIYESGLWRTTQTFSANSNPRFKISRFTNWSEAYPTQDVVITEGAGDYTISFNDVTQEIAVVKGSIPIDPDPVETGNVEITFSCDNGTTYPGQGVYVIGNQAELGNWNPANAVALSSSSYPAWTGTVSVPANTDISWKCLKRDAGNPSQGVVWQGGGDNTLNTASSISVSASF